MLILRSVLNVRPIDENKNAFVCGSEHTPRWIFPNQCCFSSPNMKQTFVCGFSFAYFSFFLKNIYIPPSSSFSLFICNKSLRIAFVCLCLKNLLWLTIASQKSLLSRKHRPIPYLYLCHDSLKFHVINFSSISQNLRLSNLLLASLAVNQFENSCHCIAKLQNILSKITRINECINTIQFRIKFCEWRIFPEKKITNSSIKSAPR